MGWHLRRIDVIHGPNLNLLGARERSIYGSMGLKEIDGALAALGKELGMAVRCRQSNIEGEIIDFVQEAGRDSDFIIINPGGYTHTSVAIRDALAAVATPAIEVHLTNTQAREEFRRVSYIAEVVLGRIEGLGTEGYLLALRYAAARLGAKGKNETANRRSKKTSR